jgi:hypothetical protein
VDQGSTFTLILGVRDSTADESTQDREASHPPGKKPEGPRPKAQL